MRVDNVVIGVDFSRAGIAAAAWVARSLAPAAQIALVHAIEPIQGASFLLDEEASSLSVEGEARAGVEEALRRLALALGPNVTRLEVRVGRAAEVLNRFAADAGADLIVVGAYGERRRRSSLLGTTADILVRGATIPVLVGPRVRLRRRDRVLAALTEGALQSTVLAWAEKATRALGGRLTAIHAIEPAAYSHMASLIAARARGDRARAEREVAAELERERQRWSERCARAMGDLAIDVIVEPGAAAEVILRHATTERAALVVLGRHEGRPLGLPRLGRTVRHVLHAARCGVLVIPPG